MIGNEKLSPTEINYYRKIRLIVGAAQSVLDARLVEIATWHNLGLITATERDARLESAADEYNQTILRASKAL
jgi:hypothetical protein